MSDFFYPIPFFMPESSSRSSQSHHRSCDCNRSSGGSGMINLQQLLDDYYKPQRPNIWLQLLSELEPIKETPNPMNQPDDIYNMEENPYLFRYDASNEIHPTAIIDKCVQMGKGNKIGAFTVIGSNGEIRGAKEFHGTVIIGDNNVISEHVTIQRPAEEGKSTVIGNGNLIMAHSHIGHDAQIGHECEICTGTIIGGYASVEDHTKLKLGVIIRNRKTVKKNSVVGMGGVVVKDVREGTTVIGVPAKEILK